MSPGALAPDVVAAEVVALVREAILAVDPGKAGKLAAIGPETPIRDVGLDSIATMEMVGYLEDHLDTRFDDEVLRDLGTFGDLFALVAERRG